MSQRPEDGSRKKGKKNEVNRGKLEEKEKSQKYKTGPPAKKGVVGKKRDAEEESDTDYSRETEKRDPTHLKGKLVPYVDLPPLKAKPRAPVIDLVEPDQPTKGAPAYKTRAPVELGIDVEKLVEDVLDVEIKLPLRNLAGLSGAIQKEIRKQVTKSRLPVEPIEPMKVNLLSEENTCVSLTSLPMASYMVMTDVSDDIPEGLLVASDPILQYLLDHGDGALPKGFKVASESESLRVVHMKINGHGPEECITDCGSMIVSMARLIAVGLGLHWDPSVSFEMESASGHHDRTLGIARNVRFNVGGLDLYLQVHILKNPPYKILLGRPFETLTSCVTKNRTDGSSEIFITDPNTGKTATVPTYRRGHVPKEGAQQLYQDFC